MQDQTFMLIALFLAEYMNGLWITTLIIGFLSFIWLLILPRIGWLDKNNHSLRHEVARDIGIAFLVAAMVTVVYEWKTRFLFETEKMEGLLNAVMSANISPNVWKRVNKEVLQRGVIRKDIELRLKVEQIQQSCTPSVCQGILTLEYGYYLYPLRYEESSIPLQHSLNHYMQNETRSDLPKFDQIIVGEKEYTPAELEEFNNNKKFVAEINLPVKDDQNPHPLKVITVREEIVNMPGQYTLIMPELAETINIHMDELPEGISAHVETWWEPLKFNRKGNHWSFTGVMLPGQGFTIQFKRTSNQKSSEQSSQTSPN